MVLVFQVILCFFGLSMAPAQEEDAGHLNLAKKEGGVKNLLMKGKISQPNEEREKIVVLRLPRIYRENISSIQKLGKGKRNSV